MASITRIALIGLRGTGKSTVGKLLADRLGWSFADSDDAVELNAGKTIARIFAEDGEPRFRDLEANAVVEKFSQDRIVLATGGGAILRTATRSLLKANGFVVWLTGPVAVLAERLAIDSTTTSRRPLLTAMTGSEELAALNVVREPLYREIAHLAVDTKNRTPDEIATTIERAFPVKG